VADTVTEQHGADSSLPPATVAVLLESALRARKNGNMPAARALLRALSVQHPHTPKIWLALATVAETRIEQRRALERVVALDPQNVPAQRGLARMSALSPSAQITPLASTPAAPAPAPSARDGGAPKLSAATVGDQVDHHGAGDGLATVVEQAPGVVGVGATTAAVLEIAPGPTLTPTAPTPENAAPSLRWPLYLIIALSILTVLIAAIVIHGPRFFATAEPTPSPGLSDVATALPVLNAPISAPALDATGEPADRATTAAAAEATGTSATATLQSTVAPPSPSPLPQPTPRQVLAPGEVVKQGQWHAILFRPQDVVSLDGSIGSLQPRGRFVLALVAVGNDGQAPALLPHDLFALIDGAGHRYAPLPAASTAYLNSYGRGQHGDLSMEDAIPSDGGNKSVPLIFDLPPGARALYLVVGVRDAGWAIGQ
jgi:hypothetical protein